MHHVTRFDPTDLAVPANYAGGSDGYRRVSHIDRSVGAVHTGFGTCELAPAGSLNPHVHSYEELFYVTSGEVLLTLNGETRLIGPEGCGFIPVGATHSWHNAGDVPCRWIDLETPQARLEGPADTFFVGGTAPTSGEELDIRDPRERNYFRWGQAQMDLDVLKMRVEVDAPAVSSSMSSALLAYSGIAVKMLIDERHGAYLGNLFMVDYQPKDIILHPHDHPVEEAFYMLEGEVIFWADDKEYLLKEGDVAYAGVGCVHAFENRAGTHTRWLESRAPLPPLHHAYRFNRDWDYLAEKLGGEGG